MQQLHDWFQYAPFTTVLELASKRNFALARQKNVSHGANFETVRLNRFAEKISSRAGSPPKGLEYAKVSTSE
jgi:hypothetical protein